MSNLIKTVIKTQSGKFLHTTITKDGVNTLTWHRAFRAKDEEAIQPVLEFLEQDKVDGTFAPYGEFGYGIIYVDWMEDKIISCQSYTTIGNAYWFNLKREIDGHFTYPPKSDPAWPVFPEHFKNVPLFNEMLEDGVIKGLVVANDSGREFWEYGDKLEMKETLIDLIADIEVLEGKHSGKDRVMAFRIDLPYELIVVEENDESLSQQISDLSGYTFDEQERNLYKKFSVNN